MADTRKAVLLRIAPALWEDLSRWARDDLRSVNAQIEHILREAVRRRFGRERPGTPWNPGGREPDGSAGREGGSAGPPEGVE